MNFQILTIALLALTLGKTARADDIDHKRAPGAKVTGSVKFKTVETKGKSVPPVVGKKIDDPHLNDMMRALGFRFEIKKVKRPPGVEAGTVLKQTPEAFADVTSSVVVVEVASD